MTKKETALTGELTLSQQEGRWLQANKVAETFRELEVLLRDVCHRLHVAHKVENFGEQTTPPSQSEKFTLVSRLHSDVLKATVTLLNENIVQSEITLKHSKVPGGVFRSVANPNVQWKIQQLQDAGNQCVRGLQIVLNARHRYDRLVQRTGYDEHSLQVFLASMLSLKELIEEAKVCLTMPRKKSLLELCQYQPTKSFNPPLPHDILLSYYISTTKLVCAAYQVVTIKQNGSQSVSVFQAEAHLPYLVDVLHQLNAVFSRTQDVITKFSVLKRRSDKL